MFLQSILNYGMLVCGLHGTGIVACTSRDQMLWVTDVVTN